MSQLHTISGTVVDAESGAALNAGTVRLLWADDGTQVSSVAIDPESRTFRFDFAPEGSLKLAVRDAREVRRTVVSAREFPAPDNETTLRSYEPAEKELTVTGEVGGEVIAVKPRKTGASAVATN